MSCKSQESFLIAFDNSINNFEENSRAKYKHKTQLNYNSRNQVMKSHKSISNLIDHNSTSKCILKNNTVNIKKANDSPLLINNNKIIIGKIISHDKNIFNNQYHVKTLVNCQSSNSIKPSRKKSIVDVLTKSKLNQKKSPQKINNKHSINNKSEERLKSAKK